MRIISGTHKGRVIIPPRNLRARPTTDYAKEGLFNVLDNMIGFEGIDVLDLFAGTGSISYEFASRGAHSVTSVEINQVHYNFIRRTIEQFGFANMRVIKANVFLYLRNCTGAFDIVFSDAPYDLDRAAEVIDMILSGGLLKNDGIFVFEHSDKTDFSGHVNFLQHKDYGSVRFSFFSNAQI